jgi:hypothetical protein
MSITLTKEIILSKCKLSKMEEVKNLNMWGCDLEDITIVKELPNVEVISLSVNKIKTLEPFSHCPKLAELYLRKNSIQDLSEIGHLLNCKYLKILWLEENPICFNNNYRNFIINTLPHLLKLDNVPVTLSKSNSNPNEQVTHNNELKIDQRAKSSFSTLYSVETTDKTPEIDKNKKINRIINSSNINGNGMNMRRQQSDKGNYKVIPPPDCVGKINNYPSVNLVKSEEDYMHQIKNLDELTKFFSSPYENKEQKSVIAVKKFNESLPSFSSQNFHKIKKNNKVENTFKNIHIINAINNLLEEMNLTQLNYLKREIDKKLKGDSNCLI